MRNKYAPLFTWNSSGFVRLRKNLRSTIYDPTIPTSYPGLSSRVETAGWKIVRRPGFEVAYYPYANISAFAHGNEDAG